MNLNSREIGIYRWNIKLFFNRRCLWRYCFCPFCNLDSESLSPLSAIYLFGPSFCLGVFGYTLVCLNISLQFIQLLLFVLLFKLLLKFRNVFKHTEILNSLTYNQNIKEDIPTALEVFFWFETKGNDIVNSSPAVPWMPNVTAICSISWRVYLVRGLTV